MEDPSQTDAAHAFADPGRARTFLVFVVDDEKPNRILMERAVRDQGYEIGVFADGVEAVEAIERGENPDLVISDIVMPRLNGLDLCHYVKNHERLPFVPVILVTALSAVEDKVRGLERGADDFLHKPFHPLELKARVRSLLRIKSLHDRLEDQNRLLAEKRVHLERLVAERTRELNDITIGLVSSLERVNELNDNDTGKHIIRVCEFSRMLADGCNLDDEMVQKVHRYASLHDVGKVGIRDDILKKPGPLTPDEWEEMKTHSAIGFELLKVAHADPIAQNIARFHHEKWSGAGYPVGLSAASALTKTDPKMLIGTDPSIGQRS
jgi:putative two-component system response regulator